jgi:hypothetical protein
MTAATKIRSRKPIETTPAEPAEQAPAPAWRASPWVDERTGQRTSAAWVPKGKPPMLSLQFTTSRGVPEFQRMAGERLKQLEADVDQAANECDVGRALADAESRLRQVEQELKAPREDLAAVHAGLGHLILGPDRPQAESKLGELKRAVIGGEREQAALAERIAGLKEELAERRRELRAVLFGEFRERLSAERDALQRDVEAKIQSELQRLAEIEYEYILSLEGRREMIFRSRGIA